MRGIRFVKELCKDFGLKLTEQEDYNIKTFCYYQLSSEHCDVTIYFLSSSISIVTIPCKEVPFKKFKYSEKYKIK